MAEDTTRIHVQPDPQTGHVAFVLEDRTLVYGLTVMTCDGDVRWTISNERMGEPPTTIIYGVTPDGFVSRTGPIRLVEGCYDVIVSGPSRTRFRIGADGRLEPKPSATGPSTYAPR